MNRQGDPITEVPLPNPFIELVAERAQGSTSVFVLQEEAHESERRSNT